MGLPSYLIDDVRGLDLEWIKNVGKIGVTAGASAPEILNGQLIDRLGNYGFKNLELLDGVEENVNFNIPAELRHIENNQNTIA